MRGSERRGRTAYNQYHLNEGKVPRQEKQSLNERPGRSPYQGQLAVEGDAVVISLYDYKLEYR